MPQVQPESGDFAQARTTNTRQQSAVEEINWGDLDEEVITHWPGFTSPDHGPTSNVEPC